MPAPVFWPAEPYHHDYFSRNGHQPYCQVIVAPKVQKFLRAFPQRVRYQVVSGQLLRDVAKVEQAPSQDQARSWRWAKDDKGSWTMIVSKPEGQVKVAEVPLASTALEKPAEQFTIELAGQGAKGSDGVASSVKSTPNSIGYVELSFAQSQSLTAAWIDNGGGAVEPTSANAAVTIESATVTGTGNDLALKIDYSGTKGYPVVLVTYEITCEKGLDASLAKLTKSFLTYTASDEAQAKLSSTGYVPITGDLLTKVRTAVSSISA